MTTREHDKVTDLDVAYVREALGACGKTFSSMCFPRGACDREGRGGREGAAAAVAYGWQAKKDT